MITGPAGAYRPARRCSSRFPSSTRRMVSSDRPVPPQPVPEPKPVPRLIVPNPLPADGAFNTGRGADEFALAGDQVDQIRRQAAALGVGDRIEVHRGLFADTFRKLGPRGLAFAFAHIDANLYQSTREACDFMLPRTSPGGR